MSTDHSTSYYVKIMSELDKLHTPMKAEVLSFRSALERLINSHSLENGSHTPDFILAGYLIDCLEAFDRTLQAREKWYGRGPEAVEPQAPGPAAAGERADQ